MNNKNKLLTFLILGAGAAASIAVWNKYIQLSATKKHVLETKKSRCYHWRLGDIHYTVSGTGKPLLLIHDLTPSGSSYEWNQVISSLSEHHTVYALDLLGCGRSEKPNLTFTNYLYVQLINDFIKSVIGKRTDVITSGSSSALALMTCANNEELFDRLLFINPDSILTCSQVPGKYAKLYKFILDLPLIGTLIYHISSSRQSIQEKLMKEDFSNPYGVKSEMVDACYEASHLGESPKSVYASVKCNYTKCNIVNAVKKIDNSIYMLGGADLSGMSDSLEEYKTYNPSIETLMLDDVKRLPQLECPADLLAAIEMFFG